MHLTVSFCNPMRIVDCEDFFFFLQIKQLCAMAL